MLLNKINLRIFFDRLIGVEGKISLKTFNISELAKLIEDKSRSNQSQVFIFDKGGYYKKPFPERRLIPLLRS